MAEFSEFCIYTILHPDKLALSLREKSGSEREGKRWVTGERLFNEARSKKQAMPILFGDSTDCKKLVCWAVLTDVKPDRNGGTRYKFEKTQTLYGRKTQGLRLRSTGTNIAKGYIRPYAICFRPPFLR